MATKSEGSSQESYDMIPEDEGDGKAILTGYIKQPQGTQQFSVSKQSTEVGSRLHSQLVCPNRFVEVASRYAPPSLDI